ncbi:MAG: DsbA family protein [Chloroflexi bacterium]|nr:DsbA family protein [Chloroflexota bacterium]
MAESGLDSLRQTHEVSVEWKAFELRPGGQFPGTPEQEALYRERIRERHEQMQNHARDRFGLEMKEGPWMVNSRLALEGQVFARKHDREDEYHRACFAAHWQEGRRLDDMNTLVEIAKSVGLDGEEFRKAVKSRQYRAEVEMDLMLAREYGIDGIPAFIFGDRYLVSGAQPVEILRQVVDRCVAEGLVAT